MKIAVVLALIVLSGCASLDKIRGDQSSLARPPPINGSNTISTVIAARAAKAQETQAGAYYSAMDAALANPTPAALSAWINWGSSLNIANCRAWFSRVDEAARQATLTDKDVGLATGLATTAAGLLEASAKTVTIMGAGLTAFNGFRKDFNDAYISAPSQDKVAGRVLDAMTQYAAQLRQDAPNLSAPEVFTRLDALGDICIPRTIKGTVNDSITQTQATVSPSGNVTIAPLSSAFQRDDSGERITAWWIPANQVNAEHQAKLLAWMETHQVNVSIPFFAHSALYAAARKQAVLDLQIGAAP